LFIPVNVNQAGCQLECQCGSTLTVPMMSEIMRLELYTEEEIRKINKGKVKPANLPRKFNLALILKTLGVLLFFAGFLVAGVGTFCFDLLKYPTLNDVCKMQRFYSHGGRVVGRDTQPISERDLMLVSSYNPQTNQSIPLTKDLIRQIYDPYYLIQLHDHFKGGLELSDNFHEKYTKLTFYYWAKITAFSVFIAVAVLLFIAGLCQPKYLPEIGEREGESWE
jgi:hypothetical protein